MAVGPEPPVPMLEVELEALPPVLEVEPVLLVVWLPVLLVVADVGPQAMSAITGAAISEVFKAMCMRRGSLWKAVTSAIRHGVTTAVRPSTRRAASPSDMLSRASPSARVASAPRRDTLASRVSDLDTSGLE